MDRFFIQTELEQNGWITDKEDIHHISKVLRLKIGTSIEVVDASEREYICKITAIASDQIEIIPLEEVQIRRELPIEIHLYQGIPKGQKMELIVQKLTEVGAVGIHPVNFHRCVSEIKDKQGDKKIERYQKIAQEAAKQSKRTAIPEVYPPISVKQLTEKIKEHQQMLLFYENEDSNTLKKYMEKTPLPEGTSIGLIVGPEGGLQAEEADMLTEAGCICLTLGNRILRTETAGLVAAAIIAYEVSP